MLSTARLSCFPKKDGRDSLLDEKNLSLNSATHLKINRCFSENGLITAMSYMPSYMQCLFFYAIIHSVDLHERPLHEGTTGTKSSSLSERRDKNFTIQFLDFSLHVHRVYT